MKTGNQAPSHSNPETPFASHATDDDRLEKTATEALGYIAGILAGVVRLLLNRKVIAFLLINAGVFIGAVALLPYKSSYSFRGLISQVINSRDHWDMAWLVTLASACITAGVMIFFNRQTKP